MVIGPSWLDARDGAGNRRLDDESDTHRAEVAVALASGVHLVPVLVGGAAMPAVRDLPEPLQGLAYRNAARIEDRRFASDVGALQQALSEHLEQAPHPRPPADHTAPGSAAVRRRPPRGDDGSELSGRRASTGQALGTLQLPTVLALSGLLVTLVWGVVVPRPWHNELWWIRAGGAGLLVVLAAAGLWSRQWRGVLAGGIAGLAGLALWMLALLSTHWPDEAGEIFSLGQDGLWNGITLVGALLVTVAGATGMAAQAGPSRRRGGR